MADIKFSCPHCHQHITCDELWGGHQLQCPSCQGTLTVPARPAPAAPPPPPPPPRPVSASAPAAGSGSSHVFKAPSGGPKLSLGKAHAPSGEAGAAAAAPQKSIPIRNLAPPPPKKANVILTIAKVVAVVAVLGVGGYFGFTYLREWQDKSNANAKREESRRGGESQVGHIANLNSVLDATEPGHIGEEPRGEHSSGATTRPTGIGSEIPMADGQPSSRRSADAGQAAGPVVPPAYTLDIAQATIPQSKVNGTLSGTNFIAEMARVEPAGTLRFIQGQVLSPDSQILVYLHPKPAERTNGLSLTIAADGRGPQVAKSWKTNPRYAPLVRQYSTGYVMKLELGPMTNETAAGRIYLALPDPEKTVIAGQFTANLAPIEPGLQTTPMTTPVARPMNPADNKAMYDRYGIRK